jgi:predicted short-subunit dehydrogenase-like oxidoreductase (DUF2520 family)
VLLVGAGRVGTAVAILLERVGREAVGVVSRSPASGERAATRLGCRVVSSLEDSPEADLYLLGVPDAAIEDVAGSLAPVAAPGALAVHFAGSLGVAPLGALAERGLGVAALHPVQACPDVGTAVERLPGSAWGVTCATGLQDRCEELVKAVGGVPVAIGEGDRALWHAAAVMTSNGIAALLATGESILQTIGVADPESVLGPLAAGAVANARAGGGGGATLTGPVVRGEVSTLRRHLEALEAQAPELVPAYRLVARTILAAAARAGRLPAGAAGQIETVVAG